jgi:hypothetical protein
VCVELWYWLLNGLFNNAVQWDYAVLTYLKEGLGKTILIYRDLLEIGNMSLLSVELSRINWWQFRFYYIQMSTQKLLEMGQTVAYVLVWWLLLKGIWACHNTDSNALKFPLVGDCVAYIDMLLSSDWQQ